MAAKLVRELMQIGVATCRVDLPLVQAVQILLRDQLESLVVLDERGHAVGVFGRREAVIAYGRLGAVVQDSASLTVAEFLRPEIPEIPPDIPAAVAAQIMLDQGGRALFLLHHDLGMSWPAAVLRLEDVLRDLVAEAQTEENRRS